MANHEEVWSLIIKTVGTADAEKLSKALQAAGMSADQAGAAIEKLNTVQAKTVKGGDTYADQSKKMDRYARSIDPVAAKLERLSKIEAYYQAIAGGGGPNAQRAAEMLDKTRRRYEEVAAAAGGAAGEAAKTEKMSRASAYQWQNLMYQVNDVVSGLAMGQRPMQVLAQQGGQIAQIAMQMNSPLRAIFSPTGFLLAGTAAAAAGMALVITRAISLESELRKLNSTALAYNNTSLSSPALQQMAMGISQGSSFTRSQAIAALRDLQSVQNLPISIRLQIAGTSGAFADATGTDLTAAMQKLSSSFSKGYEGVKALDDEYNFLTESQRAQVRSLFDQREGTKAWGIVLEALKRQMTEAADAAKGPLSESLKNLSNEINNFINAIATNPNTKTLIDTAAWLARAGADTLSGNLTPKNFISPDAPSVASFGAGLPLMLRSLIQGEPKSGSSSVLYGSDFGPWPSYDEEFSAGDAERLAGINRKSAGDITADYEKRLKAINALTPATKDYIEVAAEAIRLYSSQEEQQAHIAGELAARAAQRNIAVQQATYADKLQAEASRAVADAFAASEDAGYKAQIMESARVQSLTKSTALSLEYAAAVAKQRTETEAFILTKGKELAAFERTSGYARTVANAALSGPAAKAAASDEAAVRGVYDPQILAAQDSAQRAVLQEQMNAAIRNAATTRGTSNLDSTNTSIQAQEQELRLIQQKIGLVGKSTQVQNSELAVLNAKVEMQRLWGDELPAEAELYIENARAIAEMNTELSRQQAALQEIADFGDSAFNSIGDAMTEMAMEGKDAWESMGNVGKAIMSELYQEMVKLAIMNPLKNALGLSGGTILPTLTTVFSSLFGGSSGNIGITSTSYQAGYGYNVYAGGGPVSGPGGPTDDAILASLSNGEYVINAASTRRFRPMLDAINDNRIPAFATGGIVSGSSASSGGGASSSGLNINIINNAGAEVSASQSQNANGGIDLNIMVDRSVAKSISQRGSASNKAIRQSFGASERLVQR